MDRTRSILTALCGALLGTSTMGCYGLEAGFSYPDIDGDEVDQALVSPELDSDPSISLNEFMFADQACEGLDTGTSTKVLAQDDFSRHLERIGAPPVQIKARGNLYWFDFPGDDPEDGDLVRLRLAVLNDSKEAADELHKALLEHGPGWWGLRRSNLSILAPKTGLSEAVRFAVRYKLVCWGMMSVAGLDDVYSVPGPYMEL